VLSGGTPQVLRVGLTGGLASGKSFVGHALEGMGCFLIQADELGHQVMAPGGEAYDGIVREFGAQILDANGAINRRYLAGQVFANPERLQKLNELVHPPVRAREEALAVAFAQQNPGGIAVTEAAILIETGRHKSYARLIIAVCGEQQQIERAMARDHLTREEVLDRMHRQMPLEEKVKYADYVVDTSGTKERTLEQTRGVYQSLLYQSGRSLNA